MYNVDSEELESQSNHGHHAGHFPPSLLSSGTVSPLHDILSIQSELETNQVTTNLGTRDQTFWGKVEFELLVRLKILTPVIKYFDILYSIVPSLNPVRFLFEIEGEY